MSSSKKNKSYYTIEKNTVLMLVWGLLTVPIALLTDSRIFYGVVMYALIFMWGLESAKK